MDKYNNMKHACATFEAEWQFTCLERMNVADAVMTTDDDCIMHGVNKLYYEWNYEKRTFRLHEREK